MQGQDCEQLTLSPEASPASHFPWLESKKAKGTTVISGRKCSELSESLRRVGSSVRTYLESCELPGEQFARTWSVRDTLSPYLLLKLRLSERRTGEKESRLWATPNTMDHLGQRSPEALVRQATTTRKGRTRPANLREQVDPGIVSMWPTPTRREHKGARTPEALKAAGRTPNNTLGDAVMASDGGQLNPTWVEWLMGFPIGWTELNASETP